MNSIVRRILDYDTALHYLMRMTLSCSDDESAKYIGEMMPETIAKIKTAEFPFAECQFYDFKRKCNPSDVFKDIISFANSCGGLLIYGVSDDGKVTGINVKRVQDSITNAINSQLTPDAPTPRYEIIEISFDDGNSIVTVLVYPPVGDEVYYLKDGRRPIRTGSTTTFLPTDESICEKRKMLKESGCN
jgi:predicted HTH transcriptional regulator